MHGDGQSIDCILTPLGDGASLGVCLVCDPNGLQPIGLHIRRNCLVAMQQKGWEIRVGKCHESSIAGSWQHFCSDMAAFIASGMALAAKTTRKARLAVCDQCSERQEHRLVGLRLDRCGRCGCFISLRARGQVWDCPVGKWPSA